jgi:PAS domain S-box-containing protein
VKELNADIALRESEEKYRDLANLLPQIMFEVDNLSRLTFLNISGLKMTGYYVEDIMDGMNITELFSSDEREDILGNIKEMFSGKELKSSEYKVRRKDGTLFPALCYFNSYIGKDKNQGIRGIAVDITEHNQIERRILSKVIETEEKERKRIAKDLHDGLGPLLSSVKLYVNELQSADTDDKEKKEMLKYTNELIDDAVSSTRTIANNLMPGIITDYGLVKALQSFCNKLNIAKSINILFNAEDISLRFDSTIEITLYRVLMELINNSIKHASAKNIGITFKVENNFLNILFTDDGKGFDVSRTMNDPTGGMGLNNIINRVKSIQGTCEFISNVGAGTTVKIEINLQQT